MSREKNKSGPREHTWLPEAGSQVERHLAVGPDALAVKAAGTRAASQSSGKFVSRICIGKADSARGT